MNAYEQTQVKWQKMEAAVSTLYLTRKEPGCKDIARNLLTQVQQICPLCIEHRGVCSKCPVGIVSPCKEERSLCHGLVEAVASMVTETPCKEPYRLFRTRMAAAKKRLKLEW